MTNYGDTLTVPKPIFNINSEKKPLTLDGFEIEKPGFEKREEEVKKILMDFATYGNNNMVAMMKKMNYLLGMTMVLGFKILLDCHNKVPELKKEGIAWVPTD